jgi:hypothetical protein
MRFAHLFTTAVLACGSMVLLFSSVFVFRSTRAKKRKQKQKNAAANRRIRAA